MAGFHHVELWVADLDEAKGSWGWLLERLGFVLKNEWPQGQSWAAGGAYLTITTSPNLSKREHDRRRPGMNHMAFKVGSPRMVDQIMADSQDHGWRPLYQDRYPHAGGPDHYAGWLENSTGFKAEIVASENYFRARLTPPAF